MLKEELNFGWIEFWGVYVWRLINIMKVCDDAVEDDEGREKEVSRRRKEEKKLCLWFTVRTDGLVWSKDLFFLKTIEWSRLRNLFFSQNYRIVKIKKINDVYSVPHKILINHIHLGLKTNGED